MEWTIFIRVKIFHINVENNRRAYSVKIFLAVSLQVMTHSARDPGFTGLDHGEI